MLTINGAQGEGGGQVLRTVLGLSVVNGEPVRIVNIRAKRKNPGLLAQHVTAARAAAEIGQAEITGDAVGSRELTFRPSGIATGDFSFDVGTAGSVTLVLQTVLPALLTAPGPTRLRLQGGTHNPWAPPFDFVAGAFVPLLERMGPKIGLTLEQRGFYPAGGGRMTVTVDPVPKLRPLALPERGQVRRLRAKAIVASLPIGIARREQAVLKRELSYETASFDVEEDRDARGPGNVLMIEIESDHVTELFTGFGQKGLRAEIVARRAAKEVRRYLESRVPVGPHLADQLLLPLALAGKGEFMTTALSGHALTNIDVIAALSSAKFQVTRASAGRYEVRI